MKAKANLERNEKKMSKTEKEFFDKHQEILQQMFEAKVIDIRYEELVIKTETQSFLADFVAVLEDGKIVVIEVKASTHQYGYGSSVTRFKAVAASFPYFWYVLAVKKPTWTLKGILT